MSMTETDNYHLLKKKFKNYSPVSYSQLIPISTLLLKHSLPVFFISSPFMLDIINAMKLELL